jgi:hypothetical protein
LHGLRTRTGLLAVRLVPVAACAALVAGGIAIATATDGDEPERQPAGDAARAKGCARPYSRDSPWNTPIGRRPDYHPRSDFHIAALEGELTSDPTQYTYPVYWVTPQTPRQPVRFSGVFSDVSGDRTLRILDEPTVRIPIPPGAEPAEGSDAQIVVVNRKTGDEWGIWRWQREGDAWAATNGYRYNIRWDGVPPRSSSGNSFTSRGAGVPYLAGLVRPCEIRRGKIRHALAFAYDYPRPDHVFPAGKSDGGSNDPRDLPEGARLQLDPALTRARLRALGCRGACLTIARALQRYGMYVIDQSGRPKVMMEFEGTARWNGLVTAETVSPIPFSRFKLVQPPRG